MPSVVGKSGRAVCDIRSSILSFHTVKPWGEEMNKRSTRGQVNAFNLVPVIEHVLPDRPKTEV